MLFKNYLSNWMQKAKMLNMQNGSAVARTWEQNYDIEWDIVFISCESGYKKGKSLRNTGLYVWYDNRL